jgi:hypothetical protein
MQINRETFEAWLFAQPDERTFDYCNPKECAMCMFVKETTNYKEVIALPGSLIIEGKTITIPEFIYTNEGMNYDKCVLASGFMKEITPLRWEFRELKKRWILIHGNPLDFDEISSNGMTSRAHAESVTIKQNENTTSIIAAGQGSY